MVFQASVKGFSQPFTVLIDSGATANFISRSALMREHSAYLACDKHKIRDRVQARLADGALIKVADTRVRLPLKFLDFDSKESLYVIDMNSRYDIILGIPWLRSHEPWMNWRTGEMGSSRPAEDVIGSGRDQYLCATDTRRAQQTSDDATHIDDATEDGNEGIPPNENDIDHISPTSEEGKPLPLRPLVVAPQGALGSSPRRPRLNQAARVAKVKGSLRQQWRTSARRIVTFQVQPITDLSHVAHELLSLDVLHYRDFLHELKSGDIEEIAMIVPSRTVEVQALTEEGDTAAEVDGKKARFNSQSWEALKDNPSIDVLREYADVFPDEVPSTLPVDRGIRHEIDLEPGTKYCVTRQWPLPKEQVDIIDKHFAKKLKAGMVRESKSPHSAPTFCVKKATGGWRIVHAYNKLNAATIPAQTPIPRRDVVIDSMTGATIFTSIDLTDGYYQLLMRASDIELTAVSTPSGMLWEWLVMPQGLKNAPATFNRLVTHLFRPMRHFAQTYFDDIFVFSKAQDGKSDVEVHNDHLRKVLQRMRENNLYANLRKCVFSAPEIPVLGCFVGKDGVRADPDKIRAVSEWPQPRNLKDLRKWLGLANYLHRFSKNYAELCRPLTTLLKKDVDFEWTDTHTQAFEAVKASLLNAPVLALPDADKPFSVVCDASDFAIGCALLQHDDQGVERVIAYQSRALKAAEKNYPVHDKELLAMKYALVKFRVYLLGSKPFVVYTDHASLRTATQSPHLSQRMARWLSFFAEYNFSVAYKPGRENVIADALSRRPDFDPKELDEIMGISVVSSSLHDEIRTAYADDSQCQALIDHLDDKVASAPLPPPLAAGVHRYSLNNRLLYFQVNKGDAPRIVIPASDPLKRRILYEFHDTPLGGHLGREKTYAAVSEQYYWRRMYKYIEQYIRACETCQSIKPSPSSAAPLQSLPVPNECWTDVSLDYIFGFPKDERRNTGILVFVDRLSKQVRLAPCSMSVDAKKSARLFMDHVFRHHGMPKRLVSDRDPRFTGTFWKEVFRLLGTQLNMSTARHPESDGQTERANRVIEDILRAFCAKFPRQWSSLLSLVEFAINNAMHASTGFTPFFVNNLRNPLVPATLTDKDEPSFPDIPLRKSVAEFLTTRRSVLQCIRDNLAAAQDAQKVVADRHGRRITDTFAPGDLVLVSTKQLPVRAMRKHMQHTSTKLFPRFIGPFRVAATAGARAYRLSLPPHLSRLHPVFYVGLLKRFHAHVPLDGESQDEISKAGGLQLEGGIDSGQVPHPGPIPNPESPRIPNMDIPNVPTVPSPLQTPNQPPQRQNQIQNQLSEPPSHDAVPAVHHASSQNASRVSVDAGSNALLPACSTPTPATRGSPSQAPSAASDASCSAGPALPSSPSFASTDADRLANPGSCSASPQSSCPTPNHAHRELRDSDGRRYRRCRASSSLPPAPPQTSVYQTESLTLPPDSLTRSSSDRSDRSADSTEPPSTEADRHRGQDVGERVPTHPQSDRETIRDSSARRGAAHAAHRRSASTRHTSIAKQAVQQPQASTDTVVRYTVQKLVDRRKRRGRYEYLVHWKGYSQSQRTWEPHQVLMEDCPDLVRSYASREGNSS